MTEEDETAIDEAHRVRRHEATKDEIRGEVHEGIAERAKRVPSEERAEIDEAARTLRRRAVSEVAQTEAEIARGRTAGRTLQVVDYLFFLIYGLLGLRIGLELLGASEESGFKRLVDSLSGPLLAPFEGLFPDPAVGRFRLRISFVVGVIVYVLVHAAVKGLIRVVARKRAPL